MEAIKIVLASFICILFISDHLLLHAQDQSGLVSLDCGLDPANESYTEKTTKKQYVSDAGFIKYGERKSVKSEYRAQSLQQLWSLRSFPQGIRNCYNLDVTKGVKYLIRASFFYGNYDDLNLLPRFDLHVDANKWTSVKIKRVDNGTFPEIIYVTRSRKLQVCLAKTGATTPFISALELRPLNPNTYNVQSGALVNLFRMYFARGTRVIRSPDDIHDRSWVPYFESDWTEINTTRNMRTVNDYDVPLDVMRRAATPRNASAPLTITWRLDNLEDEMYSYMHFAELEKLGSNEIREFMINMEGESPFGPFDPQYLRVGTIFDKKPISCQRGKCEISMVRTANSTHPPLVNAFEVYTILSLPNRETHEGDVEAIKNIEAAYKMERINWKGDPCGPVGYRWEGLNCSLMDSEPPRITSLNLSSSGLRGKITDVLKDLTALETLDLSDNNLTGKFPEFLTSIKSLSSIDLSGNSLSGSVPISFQERVKNGQLKLYVEGNQNLCANDPCGSKPGKNNVVVPAVASGAAVVALIVVISIFYIFKNKKNNQKYEEVTHNMERKPDNQYDGAILEVERRFSYTELLRITQNFKKVLGKGGFGEVYHGYLNDDQQVAVKLLSGSSSQGYQQFKTEVELLLRVHHKNLVSLVGYCDEGEQLALIYEYIANGDLREHLFAKRGNIMGWTDRVRIATEAAQGLEYLHNGCKPPIVHRDVKSANILLDEHLEAKVADFGLSKPFSSESRSFILTVPVGTFGYIDPEYYSTHTLREKSDVYSFGVVLLEIITNKAVIDKTREKPYIREWVVSMLSTGDISTIVDERLRDDFDPNIGWKMLEIAMDCVNQSSSRRPTMAQVVMELNKCWAMEKAKM